MEEFFTVAGPNNPQDPNSEIIAAGCVTRNLAHGPARIPHATVHIIPIRRATRTVFIHKRSNKPRNSPGKWAFFGGHISFEMGILLSPNGLADASVETAIRESREEILVTVNNATHLIQKAHIRQIGSIGQFRWGFNHSSIETENVEYSTLFVLHIPENATVGQSPFELREGDIEWLQVTEILWDDLLTIYRASKSNIPPSWFTASEYGTGFASDIVRILDQVLESEQIRHDIEKSFAASPATLELGHEISTSS